MASFDFPVSPTVGQTYAPVGGPVFTWDGTAWKGTSQGAPVTVYVSDTAPLSPAIGQLWWNSATGTMSIWYADSDSAQWVQVSGQVLPTAPSDNGEYVMVNGVWRLVRQSFDLAGLAQQDMTVPAWGPSEIRLTGHFFCNTAVMAAFLRVSADGTTFLAGTSYMFAGFDHFSGSLAFVNFAQVAGSEWFITCGSDNNPNTPQTLDIIVGLKPSSGGYCGYQSTGTSYNGSTTNLWQQRFLTGQVSSIPVSIKALRLFVTGGTTIARGRLNVDWLA